MSKIKLKLKNSSEKDFLTTRNGQTITKEFQVFDDNDKEIENILFQRDDLDVIDFTENIVDNSIVSEVFKE